MGWTRSRRYANHNSGTKYSEEDRDDVPERIESGKLDPEKIYETSEYKDERNKQHAVVTKTKKVLPKSDQNGEKSRIKAESAEIFRKLYKKAADDPEYQEMLRNHIITNEN
jgi:hypothetical protein